MQQEVGSANAIVAQCIARYRDTPGALLPLLHAIQDALGYVPRDAVPAIARALRLSRAEVHGVITFYADFHTAAAGRHRLQHHRTDAIEGPRLVHRTGLRDREAGEIDHHVRRLLG